MLRALASTPRRILIVRLGAIGDVVRVLPMLNGLKQRFPDSEVDWVVQAKAADILRGHPQIAELFVVPFRRWRDSLTAEAWLLRRRMRARGYDLVLDFQGMLKGAVWAVAAGGPAVRVGWAPGHTQNVTWLWHHGLRTPPGKRANRHVRHRVLVEWLGVPDVHGVPPAFTPADTQAVDRFFAGLAREPRPWILAYPGSSVAGRHKRWDIVRFERALREVAARTAGTVLVGWGPAEGEEAGDLAAALGAPLIPPTTIRELTYLLAGCDLFIGMDTGPLHLAGLVGTPAVAVFGRSDPAVHGPADDLPGRAVAGPDARDLPSRKRAGIAPFTGPEPEAVAEAALQVLAEHSPAGDIRRRDPWDAGRRPIERT